MVLVKVAVGLAAATGILASALYGRNQHQLKDAKWFREAVVTVAAHKGVNELIGHPPLELGDVSRFMADRYKPLKEVKPEPLYILEVPIKGKVGQGKVRLYLNYLVPIEVVREDINAWNVGLIEVQVGDNKEHRFIVE